MKVIAFDPFLSPERAVEIGVEKVELEDIFRRSDFITLHTPLTDKTRNIIDATALAKCKKGVRIINCARGGLVVEDALYDALKSVMWPERPSMCSRWSPRHRTSSSAWITSSAPRISAHRPARRRRMWPCRWPSRWRTT